MAGRWSERLGEEQFRAKVLGPRQAAPGPSPPAGQVAGSHVPATRKVQAEPEARHDLTPDNECHLPRRGMLGRRLKPGRLQAPGCWQGLKGRSERRGKGDSPGGWSLSRARISPEG